MLNHSHLTGAAPVDGTRVTADSLCRIKNRLIKLILFSLRAARPRFINFSTEKSIPINFYPASPTRSVECVAYSSGVGPEDRIGVEFPQGRREAAFNRGYKLIYY